VVWFVNALRQDGVRKQCIVAMTPAAPTHCCLSSPLYPSTHAMPMVLCWVLVVACVCIVVQVFQPLWSSWVAGHCKRAWCGCCLHPSRSATRAGDSCMCQPGWADPTR
jgi:hypothetical protein